MAFLLTKNSVILCPHGGMVAHSPVGSPGKLSNGEVPLLLKDSYAVAGCLFTAGSYASPCRRVKWSGGSKTRSINGSPVLTNASVGICESGAGASQGAAIVSVCQTRESD